MYIQTKTRPSTWQEMAAHIEYSDLRVDTQERDIRLLCLEAEKFRIPTIVVNPVNVALAVEFSHFNGIKVAAAVSYPVGAYDPVSKIMEIQDAITDGAGVIYMVMAVGAFLDGWIDEFTRPEIEGLVNAAGGRPTRLVTEAVVLTDEQKEIICRIALEAGVDELIVTTGFIPSNLPPVSDQDIRTLVEVSDGKIGMGIMGDIVNARRAYDLLNLGITRFCTQSARIILADYSDFPGKS